jgi:glycosyltransferase involved in cell wall biosynthesis
MYLFIRSSTNPGPRVNRLIKYFNNLGKKTVYLSPSRSGDKLDTTSINRDLGNLGKFDYFDGSGFLQYLSFLFKINIKILKKIFINRKIIKIIHFSDLEVILFGGILCKFLRIPFIYNIHDNFYQRYEFNFIIACILKYLEFCYIQMSYITLVPEIFRKEAYPVICHNKIKILRNFPDFDVRTDANLCETRKIRLFYGGWISENRNIDHYFDLAIALKKRDFNIELILCGWGDMDYIKTLKKFSEIHKINFEYLGQLSQKDSVALLQTSHISIAYYNPNKIINILAASNKIPEIIGSCTILITNKHTEIAKSLVPHNISLQFDQSITEVVDSLVKLLRDKVALSNFFKRSLEYYSKEYAPSKLQNAMDEIFDETFLKDIS